MLPDALDRLPDTPFTTEQAAALGLSGKRLTELVVSGQLRRVYTSVYAKAELPDTVELRFEAIRLVLRSHVVICDRTAAWLWGVDTFDYHELEILPPLETYAVRGHTRVRRQGCTGGTRDLASEDVVSINGVLVTTPLRTAVDLACKLGPRDGLAALDGFMREHGVTRAQLRRLLIRYFRRRGVVQARRLVSIADPRAESAGESWTRHEMDAAGLPKPELQWWVEVDGIPTYRLDLAYPKHKVAVEFDGREYHEPVERQKADRARRKWLRDHGWIVIVVTKDMFTPEAISAWTQEIQDALDSRGRRVSR